MSPSHSTKKYETGAIVLVLALFTAGCAPGTEADAETSRPGAVTTVPLTVAATGEDTTSEPLEPLPGDPNVGIEWLPAGLSEVASIGELLATESGIVALQFSHDPQAWTSSDGGVSWGRQTLSLESQSGPDDHAVFSVARGGPGFVAIGSDPATPGPEGSVSVSWTSDDGLNWQRHVLDLERPELGVFAETVLLSVVGGPNGLVLTGRLDRSAGIDEHRFVVWTSTDGIEWTLIEDPFPAGAYIRDLQPAPHGFITYGYVEGSDVAGQIWWSATGDSWEPVSTDFLPPRDGPPAMIFADDPVQGFAVWNNNLLTVANIDDGIGLWSSADDHNWAAVSTGGVFDNTDELVFGVYSVTAGPAGIVLIGGVDVRPPEPDFRPVTIEQEGRTLVMDTERGTLTVTDGGTGEVMLEVADPEQMVNVFLDDGESMTVVDPGSGEQLMSITYEEWFIAMEEAGMLGEPPPDQFTPVLWFSEDGRHWTTVGLQDTFGIDEFPDDIVVGEDSLILKWSGFHFLDSEEAEEGFEEDPPAVLWVGLVN